MYKGFIRPILFLIDPEKVHHLVVFMVKFLTGIPRLKSLLQKCFNYSDPLLVTRIGGLTFENKVGMAAGFDKNAEYFRNMPVFGFSFIEIGTVTPLPQPGNPKPRLFRLPGDKALINRMGFNNKGAANAAKNLGKRDPSIIIGGNIGKNTATLNENASDDYLECFRILYDVVDYFAVNISCPNIKDLDKLQDQNSLRIILNKLTQYRAEQAHYKPIFLKISPDLTFKQLDETLSLYHETGLNGIIATNTTTDRNCLLSNGLYVNQLGPGGLSGKPLKIRSLEMIRYICKQSDNTIPVIGVGGVVKPEDAVDMIQAGASLVQVYTGFIYEGPFIVKRINKAIASYLNDNK